jgi:hypothetical protein
MVALDRSGAGDAGRPMLIAVALVFFGFVVYFTYQWWMAKQAEGPFLAFTQQGQGALAAVQTSPSQGRTHLIRGQHYDYRVAFPTSGPHDPSPTNPGFYDEAQPPTQVVHALEHGHVVVYIDEPGAEAVGLLEDWARLYRGAWDGLVVLRRPGLGQRVVLTAWTKRLDQATFDAAVDKTPRPSHLRRRRGRRLYRCVPRPWTRKRRTINAQAVGHRCGPSRSRLGFGHAC